MSQYPPPGVPYQSYDTPRSGRPTSVSVAAIMGLVIAGLTLLCDVVSLGMMALQGVAGASDAPQMPGWITGLTAVVTVVFLVIAIAWVIVSVGLLKLSPWTRGVAMKLAPLHLALAVLWAGIGLILLAPETEKLAQQEVARQQAASNNKPAPAGLVNGMVKGAAYGGPIIGLLWTSILPITMMICLSKDSAKAALGDNPAATGART